MAPQGYGRRQVLFSGSVRVVDFLMLLCFFLVIFFWVAGQASAQPLFSPTQDPMVGSRIFGAKGCPKCHAIEGVGGKIGPDLGKISGRRSFYDLAAAMWNHLPRMGKQMQQMGLGRLQLSPGETGDLIAFLYTLNYFSRPGDSKAGRQLFLKKQCVACHQVGGTGGVIGPSLDDLAQQGSPIFLASAMWNHGPAMAEAMQAKKMERPNFSGAELENLVAYLKSASPGQGTGKLYLLPGRPDEGRELFIRRRCGDCHSIKGLGGKVGGELAERKVQLGLVEFAAGMWNKAPAMLKEMKGRNIPVPQLQAEEMADIVAYLYAVQYFAQPGDARKGEQLAAAKGCLRCHQMDGKGGQIGPNFKKVAGLDQPATIISAMWNHGSTMEQKMREMSLQWPLLKGAEMADLVFFIQTQGRNQ